MGKATALKRARRASRISDHALCDLRAAVVGNVLRNKFADPDALARFLCVTVGDVPEETLGESRCKGYFRPFVRFIGLLDPGL
jgi:hypothetical protein